MILKHKDDSAPQISKLERLLTLPQLTKSQRDDLHDELAAIRAGAAGEKEAAYHIDFGWKDGRNSVVIHDMRIEHQGRVAQIDHLILMRTLDCHVLETKGFSSGVRISETGEWETRTRFGWRGIPSPVEQNRRHIEVLQAFVRDYDLSPRRLGVSLPLRFHNWVLVSPKCQVRRSGEEWDHVVKMDLFEKRFSECMQATGFFDTLSSVSKLVSLETLQGIGESLIKVHTPASYDYAAKFGIRAAPGNLNIAGHTVSSFPTKNHETAGCDKCSAPIDGQVIKYCRVNLQRFGGKLICRLCQQSEASPASCASCGVQVDQKVVIYCRFNSKRFGKRVLCRNCQNAPASLVATTS
jgi:Nuclease-related domain